ncbi:MAG: hypothetical protein GWN97_22490, partial [Thermoplasmata archaeon]|nr:hypothetical protein [Thermoplasmata archaeon]NIT80341.1 hypothetical protein [Thermoplasmata archaeon]NIY06709.1 hypothetical protein [Thermoplasmata archaeon]
MADQPRPDWLDSVEWMQSLLQSGSFSTSSRPIFLGQVTDPDEAWTIIQQALTDEELQQFIGFSIAQATTFWPEDQVPAPLVDEEQAETDLVQATIDWYNTHENFGAGWAQPGRGAEGEPVVYHRDAQTGVLVEAKLLPSPDADPPAEEMGVNTSPEAQVVTDSGQVNTREQTFPEAEPPHLGDDIPAEISFEQFQEYMQNPEWLQSLIARNMFEESQIQDGEIDLTVPYEQFREFMGGGALPFGGAQLGGVTGSPELAQALIEYMRTGDPALVEQAIPIEPLYNAGD